MSSLHHGDDDLHYCDHSHRWIAPADVDQEFWEAELATHLDKHRAAMGHPSAALQPGKCRIRAAAEPAPAIPARIIPARVIPARRPSVTTGRR